MCARLIGLVVGKVVRSLEVAYTSTTDDDVVPGILVLIQVQAEDMLDG